jgi:hypothetical protein
MKRVKLENLERKKLHEFNAIIQKDDKRNSSDTLKIL